MGWLRLTGYDSLSGHVSPVSKMSTCVICSSLVRLFKASYLQNRSESGVGVY